MWVKIFTQIDSDHKLCNTTITFSKLFSQLVKIKFLRWLLSSRIYFFLSSRTFPFFTDKFEDINFFSSSIISSLYFFQRACELSFSTFDQIEPSSQTEDENKKMCTRSSWRWWSVRGSGKSGISTRAESSFSLRGNLKTWKTWKTCCKQKIFLIFFCSSNVNFIYLFLYV